MTGLLVNHSWEVKGS